MTPDNDLDGSMNDKTRVELAVEAWKKTVDVQQHFNDIALRIRSLAISFLGVVLGATAVAYHEDPTSPLATLLAGAGVVGWCAFYWMDGAWYHQLLKGAVKNGHDIEAYLKTMLKTSVFSLTQAISEASPSRLLPMPLTRPIPKLPSFSFLPRFILDWELHSSEKLRLFYWLGIFILLVLIYMLPELASRGS